MGAVSVWREDERRSAGPELEDDDKSGARPKGGSGLRNATKGGKLALRRSLAILMIHSAEEKAWNLANKTKVMTAFHGMSMV